MLVKLILSVERTCRNNHSIKSVDVLSSQTALNVFAVHGSLELALEGALLPFENANWQCPECNDTSNVQVHQSYVVSGNHLIVAVNHPTSGGIPFSVPKNFVFANTLWSVKAVAEHRQVIGLHTFA